MFSVERAQRMPARPPKPGMPPRTMIARILHYKDRDTLLRAARDKAPIRFENKTISLYPDDTPTVQKARASFLGVKKNLRSRNLKYALLFPAKLKVIHNQKTNFFDAPEDAAEWMEVTFTQDPARASPGTWRDEATSTSGSTGRSRKKLPAILNSTECSPTKHQITASQENALLTAAALAAHDSRQLVSLQRESEEDTARSESSTSITLFPLITAQTANDF